MTRRRRWMVLAGLAVAVSVLLAAVVPGWLRDLAFFKVRRVEVLGARYLDGCHRTGIRNGDWEGMEDVEIALRCYQNFVMTVYPVWQRGLGAGRAKVMGNGV